MPVKSSRSELPRWPPWAPLAVLVGAVCLTALFVALAGLISQFFGYKLNAKGALVSVGGTYIQDLAFIFVAVVIIAALHLRPIATQFGFRVPRLRTAIGAGLLALAIYFGFNFVWSVALNIHESQNLPKQLGVSNSTTGMVFLVILTTLLVPIAEEFFFRGFLFVALWRWLGLIAGAAISAAVFAALHGATAPVEFLPPLACLGGVLCWLYVRTNSIIPGICIHALNNSIAIGVSQHWIWWQVVLLMLASSVIVVGVSLLIAKSRRLNRVALRRTALMQ